MGKGGRGRGGRPDWNCDRKKKQQQGDEIYIAVGLTAQVQLYLNAACS